MTTRFPLRRLYVPVAPWAMLTAASILVTFPPCARALPVGATVAAGNVAIAQQGGAMTLTQSTRNAIVNWQSFNVGAGEQLRLAQGGAEAAMLARVTGGAGASELLGSIQADGRLFLINPQGVIVGAGATIDTAAFTASTLDVADAMFLAGGALTFKGDSAAGIVNLGQIIAREGNVFLFAHTVKNAGEIAAPRGTAGLGAGTEVFLASPDNATFTIKLNLPSTAEKTGVENTGTIAAAQAELKAAGGSIYDLAVNQSGFVQATGIEQRPDGRVILTAAGGAVGVAGTTVARRANGDGGEIFVGGGFRGSAGVPPASEAGGTPALLPNASHTVVTSTAVLDASASAPTGHGGRAIVWADGTTNFQGTLTARAGANGGDGGFAEVSGRHTLAFAGTADLSAPHGLRGTLLLDPDDITIVAGAVPAPAGLTNDSRWSLGENDGNQVGADVITNLLQSSNVTLSAVFSLRVNAPLLLPAGGINAPVLTLEAPTLEINQNISLANAAQAELRLFQGGGPTGTLSGAGNITASKVSVLGYPSVNLTGVVNTPNLVYRGLTNATAFLAANPANAISALTLGDDPGAPIAFSGDVDVRSEAALAATAHVSAADKITIAAAGNLTLAPGSLLTATTKTQLAATNGGVFVNQAGSGLLAGAGRRAIYTSDITGAFSLGALAGFTTVYNSAFPADPAAPAVRVVYSAAAEPITPDPGPVFIPMTITANDVTKIYGQPDPVFTGSFSGGTSGDLILQPQFRILQGMHVNVGTYTIEPFGATSATHSLSYVDGTLRIDPALLRYSAELVGRRYGETNPALFGRLTGFAPGDTLQSATTGTLTFTSAATAGSAVGRYDIVGSGLTANNGNYVFAQAAENTGALTINPATLTYVANPVTRLYGDPNPAFGGSVTGFVAGDTLASSTTGAATFTSAVTAASGAGIYAITGSGLTAKNGNYVFENAAANATAITINPAPLTVKFNDVARAYGAANPAFDVMFTGFRNGDTVSVLENFSSGTTALPTSPVGSYPIGNGGSAKNYAVTVVPGTLTITPAPLTLTGTGVSTVYGKPGTMGYTVSGFLFNEPSSLLTGVGFDTAFFNNSPVGTYTYGFTHRGTAQNYTVTKVVPGTYTVTPAPLTLSGTAISAMFGNPLPALGYTVSGLLPGDSASLLSGVAFDTAFFSTTAPGSYNYGFASRGTAQNYVVTTVVPGTLTVGRVPYRIEVPDANTVAGAIPPSFPVNAPALVPGTPQFTVTTLVDGLRSSSVQGSYPVIPVIVPAAGTTLAEIEKYYDFDLSPGILRVGEMVVTPNVLRQGPTITETTLITTGLESPTVNFPTNFFALPSGGDVKLGLAGPLPGVFTAIMPFAGLSKYAAAHPDQLGTMARNLAAGKLKMDDVLLDAASDPLARQFVASVVGWSVARVASSWVAPRIAGMPDPGVEFPPALAQFLPSIIDELNRPQTEKLAAARERYFTTLAEAGFDPGGYASPSQRAREQYEKEVAAIGGIIPRDTIGPALFGLIQQTLPNASTLPNAAKALEQAATAAVNHLFSTSSPTG